jgi:hypothetical protein
MPTKEELEQENARLRARIEELEEGRASRPLPVEPSFGMSEGERQDLALTGKSTSPFTGKVTETASDAPAPDVD